MYRIVTVSVVPVALVLLSLTKTGLALECDFCYGEDDCSLGIDVPVVRCDEDAVQLTNSSLASFIRPLRTTLPTVHERYECVHVRATSVSGHVFLFTRGCVHRLEGGRTFCSLPYAAFQGSLECLACDKADRCNNIPVPQDSAGSSVRQKLSLVSLMICVLSMTSLLLMDNAFR
ncbi:uncharacterized protein LOC128720718 [Anopheles nili]|uniref:uncharacterized protein LOC128720718 n=1 Tax=Anopheles nili TaxID=185578 RepID=UPI00237B1D9D|nr:uncharacterized protein LOC128720718 [Anopheles nili]